MAVSNILQWNPNKNNMETDSQWQSDSLRLNGAINPNPWASSSANKALYSWSTVLVALCNALVAKGYTISDADLPTLTTTLGNILTTADFPAPLQQVTYASAIIFNAATAFTFYVGLAGNVISSSVTNAVVGQKYGFVLQQDFIGSRTFAWPSNFRNTSVIDITPGSINRQEFQLIPGNTFIPTGPMTVS